MQDRFFEFQHLVREDSWQDGAIKDLARAAMLAHAARLGLNAERFEADMASDACKERIGADRRALSSVGQRGTPTFFITDGLCREPWSWVG